MFPSDQFVLFYNEIFKYLEKRGPEALKKYYDCISKRQEDFCLKLFKTGPRGMYEYFERIRIEENCKAFRRVSADGLVYEGGQIVCPSLTKAMKSETGACRVYCDHCPNWEMPIFTKAGYYVVYNMISRTKPCCHELVTAFENRPIAEDRLNVWLEEFGDDLIRTNLEPSFYRGTIANSQKYENLHPRFKKAFDWLRTHDLAKLPLGRNAIDGDDIYANVMDVDLAPYDAGAKLGAHRAYIDIHVPVDGEEVCGYVYDRQAEAASDFNVADDYCLFKNPKMRAVALKPGEFAAFIPPCGAHAPNMTAGEARKHRKLVVKVRA